MFDKELTKMAETLVERNYKCEKKIPQSVYILEEMGDVLCTLLTYAYDKKIDINDLRNEMIKKFERGIERLNYGEQ